MKKIFNKLKKVVSWLFEPKPESLKQDVLAFHAKIEKNGWSGFVLCKDSESEHLAYYGRRLDMANSISNMMMEDSVIEDIIMARISVGEWGFALYLDEEENESDRIAYQSFIMNDKEIKPGEHTNFFGLFTVPLRFVGVLIHNPKIVVFYSGDIIVLDKKTRCYCLVPIFKR